MTVQLLRERIALGVRGLVAPVVVGEVENAPRTPMTVPAQVADALASAAIQAAVNSVQHAGDATVSRRITVAVVGPRRVEVEVRDDGAGFDVDAVPAERLGVRRSILERVTVAGGDVELISAPGAGTRVVLGWSEQ